jgi:F0F1-type ATP synthase membrane subunit b/b'
MDQTLHALGGILLKAIPTVGLLIIIHLYLKWMFFRPMQEVLAKRREATEGARSSAEALLKEVAGQNVEIEAALRKAREEIYVEADETRRRWIHEQSNRLDEARHHSREMIHQAKQELEAEAARAKESLAATADALADEIMQVLLHRKAS